MRTGKSVLPIVLFAASVHAAGVSWTEDFSTDPIAGSRFQIPSGHDASVFTYDSAAHSVIMHVDTEEPTSWYVRPISTTSPVVLDECSDFSFAVHFKVHSTNFFADPNQFGQIAWGFLNSTTTGLDRAGGGAGPYSFDCVSFDYYPNVTSFGGPTLGSTAIQSNMGQGFFGAINFPFGPESDIKTTLGDEAPALDVSYVARVSYDSAAHISALSIWQGNTPLNINADGNGGAGGPDQDPATIQTSVVPPFDVDSFALMAWNDSFAFGGPSVVADVEITQIIVNAVPLIPGDMNRDGHVNGLDVAAFVHAVLSGSQDSCVIRRADFDGDDSATPGDTDGFVAALINS